MEVMNALRGRMSEGEMSWDWERGILVLDEVDRIFNII